MRLTDDQIERYSRHILLPGVGGEGQARLLASGALVVGAGGLGSPALLYLAAAGIGRLGIADGDGVELSNLTRQIAHGQRDLGRNKALSAAEAVHRLNPECAVWALPERLRGDNVRETVRGYDIVLDGSDNFPTRFLVADACWLEGVPLVSAAVLRFEGQLLTVLPGRGNPCYRCLLMEPPPAGLVPTCQEAGILGPVAGVLGTLLATEAIKVLLNLGDLLDRRVLVLDALDWSVRLADRSPNLACPLCGVQPRISDVADIELATCCADGEE